jgi:hypothetical protein
MTSPAKAAASRENAKLGGWPKGKKRGKRKRIARRRNEDYLHAEALNVRSPLEFITA